MKSIKTSAWSRGLALAKMSLSTGAKAATHALAGKDRASLLISQALVLSEELGKLKGSAMKVGQMLSVFGEHFLPPEATEILKTLQNRAPPLDWPAIEKTLLAEMPPEKRARLKIDPKPVASASLGQVHRAEELPTGRTFALKIQYPGVDTAIDSDLVTLQTLLKLTRILPNPENYGQLFEEVREMMRQEVDYRREFGELSRFRADLADDPRFALPEPIAEYSSGKVLAMSFEEGVPVDSPEVAALHRQARNRLGEAALELYLRELLVWNRMQTDPHFGNYRIRIGENGEARLVLFDFGAVKSFTPEFMEPYRRMIRSTVDANLAGTTQAAVDLGFLLPEDSDEIKTAFYGLCRMFLEAFSSNASYEWGSNDLPKRCARAGMDLARLMRFRAPPRDVVFLDRKMVGVFTFLAKLDCFLAPRPLLERYLSP